MYSSHHITPHATQIPLQLRLISMHNMRIAIRQQPGPTPLTPNATLLVPAKEGLRRRLLPRVDKNTARLKLLANTLSALDILAPNASTEACVAVVSALDDFLLVAPGLRGHDGAEGLLGDDARVIGRVVDDGGFNEVALGFGDFAVARGEVVAFVFGVLEEALDFFVLHGVLDGA